MTFTFTGTLSGNTVTGKMDFVIADQTNTADWNAKPGS